MRALISAYSCEPGRGSESGAGYSILRAAGALAECWVLTRSNNVPAIQAALRKDPLPHPVHLIPIDASPWIVDLKRRLGAIRPYISLWQHLARREARRLDRSIGGFDVVHHATMSALWLPIGVAGLDRPLVVGPLSGGSATPRSLIPYLGLRGTVFDLARFLTARIRSILGYRSWRSAHVLIAQNEQCRRFIARWLAGRDQSLLVHSHASDPALDIPSDVQDRVKEVLFVGRLVTWKGLLLAIDAFTQANISDAHMVIIGAGPARSLVERRIRRLGVDKSVHLEGSLPRSEVLLRMRRASCLLFPSFHDSAGFVVSEALTLGLPVVCLDHAGPGTLVKLWPQIPTAAIAPQAPSDTVQSLAAAIRRFVSDPFPIPDAPQRAAVRLVDVLAEAYEAAVNPRDAAR